jgi:hypothetical protein
VRQGALANSGDVVLSLEGENRIQKTEFRISEFGRDASPAQSRGIRNAAMKQPPAASIESTEMAIASGLGSFKFEITRDHWSMIKPKVPT